MSLRLLIVALALALVLGGCGRRGGLEPPPGVENARPVPKPGQFPDRKDGAEEKPFVLDKLI